MVNVDACGELLVSIAHEQSSDTSEFLELCFEFLSSYFHGLFHDEYSNIKSRFVTTILFWKNNPVVDFFLAQYVISKDRLTFRFVTLFWGGLVLFLRVQLNWMFKCLLQSVCGLFWKTFRKISPNLNSDPRI